MHRNEADKEKPTDATSLPRPLIEGAARASDPIAALDGTPSQVEWAERIRRNVDDEFDRVAAALGSVAANQSPQQREETEMVISILEDKRTEVMAARRAGYFIKFWQEITDQVRQMIFCDARYQTIKRARESRRFRS